MPKVVIKGRVLTNSGDKAYVWFDDGEGRYYTRDVETPAEFHELFPVGKTIECEKVGISINSREDLFGLFQKYLGKPDSHGVAMLSQGAGVLIGMVQIHGPVSVFCTEGMSNPESDTDGFALLVKDKTYAYGLGQNDIEAAVSFALKLCAEARKGGANVL
jgi:hypothetical protein